MRLRLLLSLLALSLLTLTPVTAQETEAPTPEIVIEATPVPVVVVDETGEPAETTDENYIATLNRLAGLVEGLVGFIPAGAVGVVLIVMVGAVYVVTKITPTKRDDEIAERIFNLVLDKFLPFVQGAGAVVTTTQVVPTADAQDARPPLTTPSVVPPPDGPAAPFRG